MSSWFYATIIVVIVAGATLEILKLRGRDSAAEQAISGIDELANGRRRVLSDEVKMQAIAAICDRYFDRKE